MIGLHLSSFLFSFPEKTAGQPFVIDHNHRIFI